MRYSEGTEAGNRRDKMNTQTIKQNGVTYTVASVRPTPITGREMLTLIRGAGNVQYIAFRDSNGYVSPIGRRPIQ